MAKKTWAEEWGSSPVNYARSVEELAKELKRVRNATQRRVAALKRGRAFSYAAEAYEQKIKKTYMFGKLPDINTMSYSHIERELRIHHEFWSSKTSTAKGAKETIYEQSKNFFGTDSRGRPKHVLTPSEASKVWSLYDEFYNMYKESTAKYDSFRLQTMIGSAMIAQNFNPKDFVQTLEVIRQSMEADFNSLSPRTQDEITEFYKEVFSGYGNDFDF